MAVTYSILRTQEDASLARIRFTGRIIDLGGHRGSSYFSLIQSTEPIEVANFDAMQPGTHVSASGADHVFDFEKPFPLQDATFDHVICMNVMEHIYNYQNLVRESFRILKPGGTMHVSVPFFFNIHGSPQDYFRYTNMALTRIFEDAGFTEVKITILGDGPCSAVFQNFGGSIPTMFLKLCLKRIAMGIDTILSKMFARYRMIRTRVPLGYFVSVRKV